MAFVVALPCIGVKDAGCVSVCPVHCIHPHKDEAAYAHAEQLYIDPDTCIDCGRCVLACPVRAIFHENGIPARYKVFVERNAAYFAHPDRPLAPLELPPQRAPLSPRARRSGRPAPGTGKSWRRSSPGPA
jgi:ferredoxin